MVGVRRSGNGHNRFSEENARSLPLGVCSPRSGSKTEIAAPTSSPPFQVEDAARSLAKLTHPMSANLALLPTTTPSNNTPPDLHGHVHFQVSFDRSAQATEASLPLI